MARAVKPVVGGVDQIAFYDWGVGTDRKKISGGVTGEGIDKNIMDCYRFIVHNYDRGDHLYLFGFSRGAYTVRSLAGFIRNCGLLRRQHADQIPAAYNLYRKRTKASHPDEEKAVAFRRSFAIADVTPIEYVGVWDTVGSLGIPVPFWGTLGEREFLFHDTRPSGIIQHTRHAVSIDETREDFEPTLFDKKPGLDLKQVWFAGVHSDVGGGYEEHGLSDHACKWMIKEAGVFGLQFERHLASSLVPDHTDKQHNERKGIYLARGKLIRTIDGALHTSVKKRWDNVERYRETSMALKRLLESVGGDWSKIELMS